MAFDYSMSESMTKFMIDNFGGTFAYWKQTVPNKPDFVRHVITAVKIELSYEYAQREEYKPGDKCYLVAGNDLKKNGITPRIGDSLNDVGDESAFKGRIKLIESVQPDGKSDIVHTIYTG